MGSQVKILVVVHGSEVINIGAWQATREDGSANPLPEGAVEGHYDVVQTADGRYVLSSDHASRRRPEYPSVGDQLDALYKAGVFPADMAQKIATVKARYPKSV
jgi:hypothetical protein